MDESILLLAEYLYDHERLPDNAPPKVQTFFPSGVVYLIKHFDNEYLSKEEKITHLYKVIQEWNEKAPDEDKIRNWITRIK